MNREAQQCSQPVVGSPLFSWSRLLWQHLTRFVLLMVASNEDGYGLTHSAHSACSRQPLDMIDCESPSCTKSHLLNGFSLTSHPLSAERFHHLVSFPCKSILKLWFVHAFIIKYIYLFRNVFTMYLSSSVLFVVFSPLAVIETRGLSRTTHFWSRRLKS